LLAKDLWQHRGAMSKRHIKPTKFSSAPKKNETEVGKRYIDRIAGRRNFEPFEKPHFIFRKKGDSITGKLFGPITNYQRSTSYPILLDDGRTVEIFGNKLLHRLINKYELVGSRVRIVYIGRQHTNYGGHARKIYRVYKLKGIYTETKEIIGNTDQVSTTPKRKSKSGG